MNIDETRLLYLAALRFVKNRVERGDIPPERPSTPRGSFSEEETQLGDGEWLNQCQESAAKRPRLHPSTPNRPPAHLTREPSWMCLLPLLIRPVARLILSKMLGTSKHLVAACPGCGLTTYDWRQKTFERHIFECHRCFGCNGPLDKWYHHEFLCEHTLCYNCVRGLRLEYGEESVPATCRQSSCWDKERAMQTTNIWRWDDQCCVPVDNDVDVDDW